MSEESAQPAQPPPGTAGGIENAGFGPIGWAGNRMDATQPAHKTGPVHREKPSLGPNGPVGPVAGTYTGHKVLIDDSDGGEGEAIPKQRNAATTNQRGG